MTDLESRIVRAGDKYHQLVAGLPRASVTSYGRERISRIQRRVARHYHELAPSSVSSTYQQALEKSDAFSERDGAVLDQSKIMDQCILAGEAYANLFGQLQSLDCDDAFVSELNQLFEENGVAYDSVVGFEILDQ